MDQDQFQGGESGDYINQQNMAAQSPPANDPSQVAPMANPGSSSSGYATGVSNPDQTPIQGGQNPPGPPDDNSGQKPLPEPNTGQKPQQAAPAAPTAPAPAQKLASSVAASQQASVAAATQNPPKLTPMGQPLPTGVDVNNPNAGHPLVQKAGIMHTVMQALTGGPRYSYRVNPMTGETERTEIPSSNAGMGMALALEAISGGLAGLSQVGPGHLGRAGVAGMEQGEKVAKAQQQQDQQSQKQASDDYARKATIADTNFRMYSAAKDIGRKDRAAAEEHVASYKPMATQMMTKYPKAILAADVPTSQLGKYNATSHNAIPYKVVERPDPSQPDGIAKDKYGTPLYDTTWMVIDPNFKAANMLSPHAIQVLQDHGVQGFVDAKGKPIDMPGDFPMQMTMAMNLQTQAVALEQADSFFNNYWDTLKRGEDGKGGTSTLEYGNGNNAPMQDPQLQAKIDEEATANQVPLPVAHAMASQESSQHHIDPKTGQVTLGPVIKDKDGNIRYEADGKTPMRAHGLFQLMRGTADDMGVNPDDQDQNIHGAMKYMGLMLKKYDGSIPLALAAYNAGPGVVKDHVPVNGQTEGYVSNIMKMAAMDNNGQAKVTKVSATNVNAIDPKQYIKEHPEVVPALSKLQDYMDNAKDNLGEAMHEFSQKDPEDAALVRPMFGDTSKIGLYGDYRGLEQSRRKDLQTEQKVAEEARTKQGLQNEISDTQQQYLAQPRIDLPQDFMAYSVPEAEKYLNDHGVKTPTGFDGLWAIAHGAASPETSAARVWLKGNQYEWDKQNNLNFILKFMNPDYDQTDYNAKQKLVTAIWNPGAGTGANIANAGVAAQHLEQLREAGKALGNHDLNYLNSIAQSIGAQTGKEEGLVFDAIAEKASDEVAKVSSGGAPFQQQIASGRALLNKDRSENQINHVIGAWTRLMGSRIESIDNDYSKLTGKSLPNVDESTTALFQHYRVATPWQADSSIPKPPQRGTAATPDIVMKALDIFAPWNPKTNSRDRVGVQKTQRYLERRGYVIPDGAPPKPQPTQYDQNQGPLVAPNNVAKASYQPQTGQQQIDSSVLNTPIS